MDSRPARVARGFAAAGVSTLVAAVSHAAGGGVFPHPLLLLLGLAFSGLMCLALVGRRPSLVRLVPSVLGSQLLFHLLFSTARGGAVVSSTGHAHHGGSLMATDAPLAALDTSMIAAHAGAALITIVALRFGESAFWGLADTARLMLSALLRFLVPSALVSPVAVPLRATDVGIRPLLPVEFLACLRHRGPPAPRAPVV